MDASFHGGLSMHSDVDDKSKTMAASTQDFASPRFQTKNTI